MGVRSLPASKDVAIDSLPPRTRKTLHGNGMSTDLAYMSANL